MSGIFSQFKRHLPLLLILLFATPSNPVTAQLVSPITQPVSPITQPVSPITQPVDQQPAAETQPNTPEQSVAQPEKTADKTFQGKLNAVLEAIVGFMGGILFYEVPLLIGDHTAALVLLVLIFGGIFFTIRFGFINIRLFTHSINVLRGKYDKPEDEGEITHFQALTSALSATVGLGNIGGVAIAIALGGPGAVFWMWCIAFFGMSAKFTSCSFAQLYRRVKPDGTVLGGPMVYLDEGIKEHYPSLAWLGKTFGVAFAIFTIGASFGGGNMFQGNQTFKILSGSFNIPQDYAWIVGVIMAALVGVVIIGGIKRIGEVTSKIVPLMCVFYCTCCLIIILTNASAVPAMITSIFVSAFRPDAMFSGGMIGVLLMGARRAAFSNEAGLGSAAIAHAAARTEEPIREGVVAMIGPFIDTIIVCTMTALTILITKSHIDIETGKPFIEALAKEKDVALTAAAFATLGSWVPYLLCIAVCVFAYSTMISWSYYGERSAEFLLGERGILPYRVLFVLFVILGPIVSLKTVIDFSDMMLFSMAFPNIIGLILLSGSLRKKAKDYVARLKSGEISRTN
ncbi:MAG: alanine/glycine:cation symporter family protein [Pirellulaceae bacterium]|nr:alanine/glycine:cation symporter family protein [Pirellulaceae bacterium]